MGWGGGGGGGGGGGREVPRVKRDVSAAKYDWSWER